MQKKHRKINIVLFLSIFVFLFFFNFKITKAFEPPIGIPDPGMWGTTHPIDTANPTQPAGWPSVEVSGYYYIDNLDVNATDVDNIYGYPNKPRVTVPNSGLSAGSKVFIKHCSYLTWFNNVSGTAENPNWIIGVDGGIIQPQSVGTYLGFSNSDYWIVDGITFDGTNTSNVSGSLAFNINGGSDYVTIRNSIVQDMPVADFSEARGTAAWFSGLTYVGPSLSYLANISNVVLYNLNISNNAGGQFLDYESGRHAILSAGYKYNEITYGVDSLWILDSTLQNNPEDGVQLGLSALGSDQTKCRNIYIGGNTIINNGENAIDLKASSNIVVSENVFSGYVKTEYRAGATSGSDGSVGVENDDGGGPLNDWWIFNEFSNSRCGIRNQSSGGNHYIIGNLFYDLNKAPDDTEPTSTGYNSGVAYWQSSSGSSTHIVNNTIYDVHGGIYFGNVGDAYVKGNIVSDIVDRTLGYPIAINNFTSSELTANIYYDKDGTVRRDLNALGITDQIDIDPLFIDPSIGNYRLQDLSPGVGALTIPNEYALFNSLFSKNIAFDIEHRIRSEISNISIGAYEYVVSDGTPPSSPEGLSIL